MPHILIIEDDTDLAFLIKYALEPLHCTLHIANNGEDGLQQLHTYLPEIVVLDLHLPYVTGEEIVRNIRTHAELSHTKILVYSAAPLPLPYSVELIVQKPFALSAMRNAVQGFLAAKTH